MDGQAEQQARTDHMYDVSLGDQAVQAEEQDLVHVALFGDVVLVVVDSASMRWRASYRQR